MEPDKVEAITNWPIPTSITDIRSFTGLAGYYRRFISMFSDICAPLTALLKKDVKYEWSESTNEAFNKLKQAITSAPVLINPDQTKSFTVVTDASGYAIGAQLCQDHGNGLQPIAFMSKKMIPAELNYPVHEQELLAVICALDEWRHYLYGQHFTIITDHRSLQYINTQPHLSARQRRWVEKLQQFDFTIEYKDGKSNVVADALSRRADHKGSVSINNISEINFSNSLINQIKSAYVKDNDCTAIINDCNSNKLYDYLIADGLIFKGDAVYVPNDEPLKSLLLTEVHDSKLSGHVGIAKTIELLQRQYYWPGMRENVKKWIKSCVKCQSNKSSHLHKQGLLQSIPSPSVNWECVSMDFITQLPPTTSGYDAIVVFVDKLSKMVHIVPATTSISAPDVAVMFYKEVVRLHGVPKSIISDRDPRFTSNFWKCLWSLLGTKLSMSTAFHPESDGQTERTNRTLEDMLRAYVNYEQSDWDQYLVSAEIAINNNQQTSTKYSPYYLNYGQHPIFPHSNGITREAEASNPTAGELHEKIMNNLKLAKDNIDQAQQRQTHYANEKRTEMEYQVGELVWLSRVNLKLIDRAPKLASKFIGPFEIIERIGQVAYKLKLPHQMKIHPVFHVSLLRTHQDASEQFPSREVEYSKPPPIVKDNEQEYEVERIVNHRSRGKDRSNHVEYLVLWKGYPEHEKTWEPEKHLANAKQLIKDYHQSIR
jgi:hypothetical protein